MREYYDDIIDVFFFVFLKYLINLEGIVHEELEIQIWW